MVKNRYSIALIGVLALVLAGCATHTVRTDFRPEASFSQLRTYLWLERADSGDAEDPSFGSPLLGDRIQTSVDEVLSERGYQRVSSGDADFRIAYSVSARQETVLDASYASNLYYGDYWFRYRGFGRYSRFGYSRFGYDPFLFYDGFGPYPSRVVTRERLRGTLILDIYDAGTEELIWRGWATGMLPIDPKPQTVQKFMREAANKILEEFPPGDGGSEAASEVVTP